MHNNIVLPMHNGPGSAVTVQTAIQPMGRYGITKPKPIHGSSQENLSGASLSDHEDDGADDVSDGEVWAPLPVRGYLSKWTNLLHGWQERYFVLSDGALTYYRNADELDLGSRGSVRVRNAYIKSHEYDECRFEVRVGDLIWYLRGLSATERQEWISAIERHRIAESGYGSEKTIHRQNSMVSLNSAHSPSINSTSSYKKTQGLTEKLAEMETFKEILCKQVDSLQAYFDACSSIVQHGGHDRLEHCLVADENRSDVASSSNDVDSEDVCFDDRDDDVPRRRNPDFLLYHHQHQQQQQQQQNRTLHDDRLTHDLVDPVIHPPSKDLFPSDSSTAADTTDSTTNLTSSPSSLETHTDLPIAPPNDSHTPKADRRISNDQPNDKPNPPKPTPASSGGGFFSRFLPFRSSNSPAPTPPDTDTVNNSCSSPTVVTQPTAVEEIKDNKPDVVTGMQQYNPSSRFSDLSLILQQHGSHALDFKGEGHMFKATTTGILTNLAHTIEMMQQHEDHWRRRLEREVDKRRRLEETQRAMAQEIAHLRQLAGIHSAFSPTNGTSHNSSNPGSVINGMNYGHSRFSSYGSIDFHHHTSPDLVRHSAKVSVAPVIGATTGFRHVGPDFEEGPNSLIREEEFFDAIDAESDKMEQDEARLEALKSAGEAIRWAPPMPSTHPLYTELDKTVKQHIRNFANPKIFDYTKPTSSQESDQSGQATSSAGSTTLSEDWQILCQEGEMIIFKRELETDDGIVLDPLQAVHVIEGVTAREMCTYFWDVRYRLDWEFTIDQAPTVLEVCGDDTVVIHQLYKRVWPTTQRDGLYWSHICPISASEQPTLRRKLNHSLSMSSGQCSEPKSTEHQPQHQRSASMGADFRANNRSKLHNTTLSELEESPVTSKKSSSSTTMDNVLDSWMVINASTDYLNSQVPSSPSPTIRLGLEVVLFCRTEFTGPKPPSMTDLNTLPRDQLRTRLVYMANINPGGWVPAAGLRSLARREYPRFLKRFSAYVKEQTHDKPPLF